MTTFVLFWWSQVAAGLQVYKEASGGPACDPTCPGEGELWCFFNITIQQIQCSLLSGLTVYKLFKSRKGCFQDDMVNIPRDRYEGTEEQGL